MTEVDIETMRNGYNKFITLRNNQLVSNKKYRESEKGKQKMYDQHKAWFDNIKNDPDYKKKQNILAKARYHIRKAKKIEQKNRLEKFEKEKALKHLGEIGGSQIIENQEIVTII